MVATPTAAVDTASAVLALSKAAWKLGSSLSKIDQETRIVDTTIKNLVAEVKSLSNQCDLVYAELEDTLNKSDIGSSSAYDFDARVWICLATQVEEISRTMQDLELFIKSVRADESDFISQPQRQRKLDMSKGQITSIRKKVSRHTENLRTTLLLVNT